MLTKEEQNMLRLMAAYNEVTEDQAKDAIVKQFLNDLVFDEDAKISQLLICVPIEPAYVPKPVETPEKPKRKGGRPRKSVNQFVEEVHQADKMSKDEFVDYFGGN